MSTIKSSAEHLTLNADGASKDIKFQANGVEKASISSAGAFTSTTIDATALTGTIPNFTSTGIDDNADATAITITSAENVGVGTSTPDGKLHVMTGSAGTVSASSQADDLVVENSAEGGITILTPDASSARIRFSSPSTNTDVGGAHIFYRQNINKMSIGTTVAGGVLQLVSDNSQEAMLLDSTGAVTMPLQPAFLVNSSSQSNLATNTTITVDFDNERYDVNSDFNTSTQTFTAPVTGKYHFDLQLLWNHWDSSASYYYLQIVTSNRTYYELNSGEGIPGDPQYHYGHVHALADMDAGDTALVKIIQSGGAVQTGYDNQSIFSGYLAC